MERTGSREAVEGEGFLGGELEKGRRGWKRCIRWKTTGNYCRLRVISGRCSELKLRPNRAGSAFVPRGTMALHLILVPKLFHVEQNFSGRIYPAVYPRAHGARYNPFQIRRSGKMIQTFNRWRLPLAVNQSLCESEQYGYPKCIYRKDRTTHGGGDRCRGGRILRGVEAYRGLAG